MSEKQEQVISAVAESILALPCSHPIRVGISGITAAGKSTFAANLASVLQKSGRQVISTSIDSFHNPSSVRYRMGRDSPEGYYRDAHDYESVRNLLLKPLGPYGSLEYLEASLDLKTDTRLPCNLKQASKDAILTVDGTFLFNGSLRDHWDYRIFLDVDFDIARARGVMRDAVGNDGKDWNSLYTRRYHAACALYLEEWNPASIASVCIDNRDPTQPFVQEKSR